jgi:hypothetical protein
MIKISFFVLSRPSVVLTGREAGMVDTWYWSYQLREPAATNKISSLPVSSRFKFRTENDENFFFFTFKAKCGVDWKRGRHG